MKKILLVGSFVIAIFLSAFIGNYISEQKNLDWRTQNTNTMIAFSIDKVETLKSGYDADTMEALISNVYAAYEFTPDSRLSEALHDLWNALIFDGENIVGREDYLIKALQDDNAQEIKDIAIGMRTAN